MVTSELLAQYSQRLLTLDLLQRDSRDCESVSTNRPATSYREGDFGYYKRHNAAEFHLYFITQFDVLHCLPVQIFYAVLVRFLPTSRKDGSRSGKDTAKVSIMRKYDENDDDYVEVCSWSLTYPHLLILCSPDHLQVSPAYHL